jgi:divalent metal cation (Fe/Co/Zn/Cd) transporter
MHASRISLVADALRLSYVTIAWNGIVGALALGVGLVSGSLALAAFALNALLDSSASVVLVWRFRHERTSPEASERVERRAQAFIVVAMWIVALYVGFEAVRALADGSHPDESLFGVTLAAVSLLVLPWLGKAKLCVASGLGSRALRGDGVLTLAAAALALVTLVALVAVRAFGWWWADALAALLVAAVLGFEGARAAIHHRFG